MLAEEFNPEKTDNYIVIVNESYTFDRKHELLSAVPQEARIGEPLYLHNCGLFKGQFRADGVDLGRVESEAPMVG